MSKVRLESFLREISIKTTHNDQYPVLTSSKSGLFLQSDYFNKQVASKDNTGYKIIKHGQFTYRAMSDTGEFFPNMLECSDIGIVSPAYPVFEISDAETIMPEYLKYFFKSNCFQNSIASFAQGSTRTSVKFDKMKTVTMELPRLNSQQQIISSLDGVTKIIKLRKQQLFSLDTLIKARFVEMFGEFKTNSMDWPIVGFNDIAIIDGNMTTDYDFYADYPHIGIDSIEKETGLLNGYRTVAEDGVISGKYVFSPKHIIYSKIRPNLNKVALPDFDGVCSADAYPILPIEGKCNRVFLAYDMRSQYFLDYILQFCNRTNMPKVNRKEVSGFKTPLPPFELQNAFAAFVAQVDKSKFVCLSAIIKSIENLNFQVIKYE